MSKMSFGDDIAEWTSEAQEFVAASCAETTRRLFRRVIELSPSYPVAPYSRGHFMHNWRIADVALVGEIAGETTESAKIAEVNAKIDDEFFLNAMMTTGQAVMTNSTEYITEIEYQGWPSGKPAYAPVAKAIAELM